MTSTVIKAALWVAALMLVRQAAVALDTIGAGRPFVVVLAFCALVVLGVGYGIVALSGLQDGAIGALLGPMALGWVSVAGVAVAATYGMDPSSAFWVLVMCGLLGWFTAVWSHRRALWDFARDSFFSTQAAVEVLLAALILRVAVAGPQYLVPTPSGTQLLLSQYFDLPYHLAVVKEGLYRGLPLGDYALMAGSGPIAYHAGFDTLCTVLLRGLGLSVDATYYGVLLPLNVAGLVFAIFAAGFAWRRSLRAGVFALLMLAVMLAGVLIEPGVARVFGNLGATPFTWFIYNPPGALGATAVIVVLAVLATNEGLGRRALVVCGAILGASVCMKAQIAIAAGPAFVAMLAAAVVGKRVKIGDATWAAAAAAVCAAGFYLTTRGAGSGPSVSWGAMAHFIVTGKQLDSAGVLWRWIAARTVGPVTEIGFLVAFTLIAMTGWRLVLAAVALVIARRRDINPLAEAWPASVFIASMAAAVILVALTLVQRESYTFNAWNIAWHTMQMMWPLSLVLAAVLLDAACSPAMSLHVTRPTSIVGIALLAVLVLGVGIPAMESARQVGTRSESRGFVALLLKLPATTPPDAVVAQRTDTYKHAWVTSVGGRRTYLERSVSLELARGLGDGRRRLLDRLYQSDKPNEVRRLAADAGIDYVIVGPNDAAAGLRSVGRVRAVSGKWELLEL